MGNGKLYFDRYTKGSFVATRKLKNTFLFNNLEDQSLREDPLPYGLSLLKLFENVSGANLFNDKKACAFW